MANQQDDDGASPLLPHDVVTEIFAYLPAKSVSRFRCVSRSWDATLSSALFVKLHLQQANNDDKPRFFFSPTFEPLSDESESTSRYQFYAWQPGTPAVTKLMPNNFSCPAPLTTPLHGIVLLRCVNDGGYFLCNPSTGEVHPLPDSRAPFKMNPGSNPIDLPFYLQVAYALVTARRIIGTKQFVFSAKSIMGPPRAARFSSLTVTQRHTGDPPPRSLRCACWKRRTRPCSCTGVYTSCAGTMASSSLSTSATRPLLRCRSRRVLRGRLLSG
ncbi:hypothetical protein ACQ4PT_046514 [Festuca glaucescens]